MEEILNSVEDTITKDELKVLLETFKMKIDADNELLRRADLENQRKRLAIDKDNAIKATKEKSLDIVFDVIDIIDYAKRASSELVEALDPLKDKILSELTKKDINIIQTTELDTNVHEVVSKIGDGNSIIETVKNGFMVDGRIARYPKVVIG